MKKYLYIIIPVCVLAVSVLLVSLLASRGERLENREMERRCLEYAKCDTMTLSAIDSLHALEDSAKASLPGRALVVCVDELLENQ